MLTDQSPAMNTTTSSSKTSTYDIDEIDYDYDTNETKISNHDENNVNDNNNEEENKEYKRKLLISLAMLLPAIAAIIGVMAWAISAEVVLGSKREAARRMGEGSYLKPPNRYDYSRFTSSPMLLMPSKEMLIDSNHPDQQISSNDNLNALQKHIEELSKEYLNRRIDLPESADEEMKNRLTNENISQLFAKLLSSSISSSSSSSSSNSRSNDAGNVNEPRIVLVAPLASQTKDNSKTVFSETKVTKPKAFDLKIAATSKDDDSRKQNNNNNNNNNNNSSKSTSKTALKSSIKRKTNVASAGTAKKYVQQEEQQQTKSPDSSKRKTASQSGQNEKKQQQQQQQSVPEKNSKTKHYEKKIDTLLAKIENLEKQKFSINKPAVNEEVDDGSEEEQTKHYSEKKSSAIAKKIKKFMDSAPIDAKMESWESIMPPMLPPPPPPPPPPPMPFMPFMPPPPMPNMADNIPDQDTSASNINQMPLQNDVNSHLMPIQADYPEHPSHTQQQYYPQASVDQYDQQQAIMPMGYQHHSPQPAPMPEMYMQQQPRSMMPNVGYVQRPSQQSSMQDVYASDPQQQPQTSDVQDVYASQQPMSQQNLMMPAQYQQPMRTPNNVNYGQTDDGYLYPDQMNSQNSYQYPSHTYIDNEIIGEPEMPKDKKTEKTGLFRRRFQLSKIFNSVIPGRGKKQKNKNNDDEQQQQQQQLQQEQQSFQSNQPIQPTDNRIMPPSMMSGGGYDPMMVQESQYHSSVDRGHHSFHPLEAAGVQLKFGGGPLGGGSQVKVSPMALLKTIALPLMKRPALNLNGKVVFGVVLENGVGHGKKPKTVFQHYSTGRIKR